MASGSCLAGPGSGTRCLEALASIDSRTGRHIRDFNGSLYPTAPGVCGKQLIKISPKQQCGGKHILVELKKNNMSPFLHKGTRVRLVVEGAAVTSGARIHPVLMKSFMTPVRPQSDSPAGGWGAPR